MENNLLVNLNDSWMSGVVLATKVSIPSIDCNDIDNAALIRYNTLCFALPRSESKQVETANAGQVTISGTVYRIGADASSGACEH